ncbi:hypothetical protein AN1V17_38960 [Vallitalea sediminicola]
MTDVERNHPLYVLKQIFGGVISQIVIIILIFTYLNKRLGATISILIIIGLIILYCAYCAVSWYKTMYYINENAIFYQKGILNVNKREVPLEKITTIDISQGLFERIFSISKIKIDTENVKADKSEITLTITKEEALLIKQKLLKDNETVDKSDNSSTDEYKYKLSFKDLILYSIASNSVFQGLIIIVALYNYLDDIEDVTHFDSLEYINKFQFSVYIIIGLVLSVFIICLIVSFVKNCIKYSYYSVYVEKDKLHISHGLISKKNYTFDKNKVKGIHVKQKFIMQLFHVSTIEIESIGYGDEKGERAVLFPFCNDKLRVKIINDLMPEFNYSGEINKAPQNAYIRFIFKKLLFTLVIVGIVTYKVQYGFISILLLGVALLLGHMEFKNTGIGMSDQLAYMSYSGFQKKQSIVKIGSIQSIKMSHTYFQRKKSVCNYTINIWGKILGKNITVKNVSTNLFESYIDKL